VILLGTVKDLVRISGYGTTFVLEFANTDWKFRVGDEVELRTLEGARVRSRIKGFSHLKPLKPQPHDNYGIQLEDPEPKVPVGTVVWLLPKE
jgi:hypothetical protein